MRRFYVIDALRSVLALWVAIGHAGVPLFGAFGQSGGALDLLARGFRSVVWGPPAVIAFFVISGFCIHYPFAQSARRCQIPRFYARRYLRILVPVAFTVAMFKIMFPDTVIVGGNSIFFHSALWSVLCEEMFYGLYPIFNRVCSLFGLGRILKVAFVIAVPVAWFCSPADEWQDLGIFGTAIVLLPVWLLGCHLAERIRSLKQARAPRVIWSWRLGAWATMWVAEILHFHGGIPQTRSSIWIGVYCYFWLRAEINRYGHRAPWAVLIWAGRWSYSMYLVHPLVIALCFRYELLSDGSPRSFVGMMALILIGSYLFYLGVERPSHGVAKKVALFSANEPSEDRSGFTALPPAVASISVESLGAR